MTDTSVAQDQDLPPLVRSSQSGYPMIHSLPLQTPAGTPYLRRPGVVMSAAPRTDLSGLAKFLEDFGEELDFGQYLDDPTELTDGAQLIKTSGQACYASFGPRRTKNENAGGYLDNIASSGHGSVLEHANYSLFIYGVSRSLTHELIRHRAGFAYSQLSQRYVSGRVLRFVERPEYVTNPTLHTWFEHRIDGAAAEYAEVTEALVQRQRGGDAGLLAADAKTDLRKKVQQVARSVLPNETETFLMMTGNVRAWRHFINMRASSHAEVEIRALAVAIYRVLSAQEPLLFADMELVPYPTDGTYVVNVKYPKV